MNTPESSNRPECTPDQGTPFASYEQGAPKAERIARLGIGRRAVACATTVATVLSSVPGSHTETSGVYTPSQTYERKIDMSDDPYDTMATSGAISIPPQDAAKIALSNDSGPSAELVEHFQNSLVGSTCTQLSAEKAATIYHDSFEINPYEPMDPDELLAQVPIVLGNYERARASVDFPTTPDNFAQLEKDVQDQSYSIPIADYQAAIQAQLASVGVEARFTYTPATSDKDADARNVPRPTIDAWGVAVKQLPLTDEQWNSPIARKNLVSIMRNIARTPSQLIKDTGHFSVLYFTDAPGIQGEASTDGSTTFIALHVLYKDPTDYVFGHEFGHAYSHTVCPEGTDTAWNNLNPAGFTYSSGRNLFANIPYTDTANKAELDMPGVVATVTRYAGFSTDEDGAETIAFMLNPAQITDFFERAGHDSNIPLQKLSLQLGRIQRSHPAEAKYFATRLRLGQLQAVLADAIVAGRGTVADQNGHKDTELFEARSALNAALGE